MLISASLREKSKSVNISYVIYLFKELDRRRDLNPPPIQTEAEI